MDPLTHGITGALLGKGYFSDRYGRVAVFAATLGSVFPDIDVICDLFSHDPTAIIKFHRGFTHSFLGLPLFAALLAWLTRWWEHRRGRDSSSWNILTLAYGVGIASHILLDAMTSFGTRIWNPVSRERAAWDLLFIIDFGFTAIVLLPQVIAWVFRQREKSTLRAMEMWILFSAATLGVWKIAGLAGFPFGGWFVVMVCGMLAGLFFLPARRAWGFGIARSRWCRVGVYAVLAYLLACGTAHRAAIERVRGFATGNHIAIENLGALPLPPSLLSWSGAIRTSGGVYQSRFDLRDAKPPAFHLIPDSANNPYVEEAMALPDVRTYLWFARFPVIRASQQDGRNIVEFSDLRFFGRRNEGPLPFTFRVVLDSHGALLEEGWAAPPRGTRPQTQGSAAESTGSK